MVSGIENAVVNRLVSAMKLDYVGRMRRIVCGGKRGFF